MQIVNNFMFLHREQFTLVRSDFNAVVRAHQIHYTVPVPVRLHGSYISINQSTCNQFGNTALGATSCYPQRVFRVPSENIKAFIFIIESKVQENRDLKLWVYNRISCSYLDRSNFKLGCECFYCSIFAKNSLD